ncbi:hypothetical protein SUGI_0678050 [Cryptomeria japonica]|nr:hypothetical protein SUGI_0678050 [Cryptomeria japonica]
MARRIWEGSGWSAEFAIQTLKDKCLIEIVWCYSKEFDDNKLCFRMHDHLRDLGRELADELGPLRLWHPKHFKRLELMQFKRILTEVNGRCLLSIFDWSFGAQITCFLGKLDDCAEESVSLLWLHLDLTWSVHTSIPSWIPFQNLQGLIIVDRHLRSLWLNDREVLYQLKELLLYKTSLVEYANSLKLLINLEKLAIRGRPGDDVIQARSLLNSLRKLRHLRSLVLTHLPISGDVALNNCGASTVKSSMSNLENIEIRDERDIWKRVIVDGCEKLQCITGIEELKELKYLHLSALGNGGISNCICNLQRLPSELTTVIGRAAKEASLTLTANLFSDLISDLGQIHIAEDAMPEVPLETVEHLSTIILCTVVQINYGEITHIPLGGSDSIESYMAGGEWIVTFVVTAKLDWIRSVSLGAEIKKGCIIVVKNSEEGNALCILKRIIGQLYDS